MNFGPTEIVLSAGLVVATVTDLRTGKIYNALTFPLMALGIAIHLSEGDVRTALVGLGVAWAIHYLLFRLGVERGGDAKLFMAIGALRGWSEAVEATLWSAFVYLPVGLLVLLLQGKLGNLMAALRWTASGRAKGEPRPEPTMLKTAPIVAVAWLMAWATHWLSPTP